MPTLDPKPLQEARTALSGAGQTRISALAALAAASTDLQKLKRTANALDPSATTRYKAARDALVSAKEAERQAGATLRELLAGLQAPSDAIAGLDPEYPIVLFPIRLETRFIRFDQPIERPPFRPKVGELRVRIYPDGIVSDSHEPMLTEVEFEAGKSYWKTAWKGRGEQDAWTAIVAEVGAPRAAWIVKKSEPTNVATLPASPVAALAAPAPVFSELQTRPLNWHRAPVARLLPDRWVVQAYPNPNRGLSDTEREAYRILSGPVAEPLALTLGFAADGVTDDRVPLKDALKVDPEILWTFDFKRAEEVGMAVRIPLAAEDFTDGLARVLVLGVKASLEPEDSARQLEELFEHHRVSRGLAFVPQGTPTNSTIGAPSGYPPPDPRATASFRAERGQPLARSGSDGARFMTALGLPGHAADHIAGADRKEQRAAQAMATALWPATIGYYLKQMMASGWDVEAQPADLDDNTIEAVRRHFINFVRGRGPLPAFRVGDIPYGVLPVSVLGQGGIAGLGLGVAPPALAQDASPLDAKLSQVVWNLAKQLISLAELHAPRVGRTFDAIADLIEVFRMEASAREVYVRAVIGDETFDNIARSAGLDERVHDQIPLDTPIILGTPEEAEGTGLTVRTLLGFPAPESDEVIERPPSGGGGANG